MAELKIWKRKDMEPDTLAPLVLAETEIPTRAAGDAPESPESPESPVSPESGIEDLSKVDLFRGMTPEQIAQIDPLAMPLHIWAGQQLVQAGDKGDLLFTVLAGKAQLSASSSRGEITVRVAGPGESFPLAVIIGTGVLITSIEALTDMDLLAISKTNLQRLCERRPDIGMHVYREVATVLGERYKRTLGMLTETAERTLREADFFANV